ncbi:MAG: hypothetical protein IKJ77_02185 [Firmicutes bacterium]|nr:hypothetical protein [Bacillota bacterium]
MNYEAFKTAVTAELTEYLPAEYRNWQVSVHEIVKVNGTREALHVMPPGGYGGSPTLYLDELFDYYENCSNFAKTCQKAAAIFVIGMDYLSKIDICDAGDLPKDNIIFVLIPQRGNERLLAGVPHRLIMDLALIYRVVLISEQDGINSAIVTKEMAEELDLTEEDLYKLSIKNTPDMLPLDLRMSESGLFVLSNQLCISGASALLYPGVLSDLAEDVDSDLFILPGSLNEVFIIPDVGQDVRELNRIVASANEAILKEEDMLSDHAYYYHRATDQICTPKWE